MVNSIITITLKDLGIRSFLWKSLFFVLLCTGFLRTNGQVVAKFTASDTAGCAPFIVHFTNKSTGATNYSWNLGNGTTSLLTDASASYTSAGTYTVTLTASNGASSQTDTIIIRAYLPPTVNFSASTNAICPGSPITFSNTSFSNSWGGLTYIWNFGDGSTSTIAAPVNNYMVPGAYSVTLFATSSSGCISSSSKSNYIYVYTPPSVKFSAATTFFCKPPASVFFGNTTTGTGPFSYVWSFGDGGSSALTSPSHTYTTSGSDDVKLWVKDGNGCIDSLVQTAFITVGGLTAGFTLPAKECLDNPVSFTNTSTSHISSKWYFGDGTTSTSENPSHHYPSAGIYTTKLVIFDGTCHDSVLHSITIIKPTGSFTISPTIPCQPFVLITFNASVPSGAIVSWSSLIHGTLGSGNPFTYTYPPRADSLGQIDAFTMYITDVNGCKDTIANKIDTLNIIQVNFGNKPDYRGCTPFTDKFSLNLGSQVADPFHPYPHDKASFPYPTSPATYYWDFADGSPASTSATPTHTFTAQGLYPVTCIITTTNGCYAKGIDTVKTGDIPPNALFTRSPSRLCVNQPVHYTPTATGLINEYVWSFGDGKFSFGMAPSHAFTAPGIYTTDLLVDYNGCAGLHYTMTDTVDSPGAAIAFKYTCIPDNGVAFGDSSHGDDTHIWAFGDGTTSTLANPIHYFPALQTYTVAISTHNNASGCSATDTVKVYLERLAATITPNESQICHDVGDTVTTFIICVTDSANPPNLVTYATQSQWYVNGILTDTQIPFLASPTLLMTDTIYHIFTKPGYDTVMLVLTDTRSCLDTVSVSILVARPKSNFGFTPSVICSPLPVTFSDLSSDVTGTSFTSYSWSFGDTSSAIVSTAVTTHSYTAGGTYTIQEIVTDNVGCSDTFNNPATLTVNKPTANFSSSTTISCVGIDINFPNTSTKAYSSQWFFGDGTSSTVNIPDHIYYAPDTYSVTLVAYDLNGCTDTMTQNKLIAVSALPAASFKMSDTFAVCPPLNVNFTNTSTGYTSSSWVFGDNNSSNYASPDDIYVNPGLYTIKLTAANDAGCTDTAIGHASIFGYAGAFSYTPESVCAGSPVHFTAPPAGAAIIEWDFDDGVVTGPSSDTISHSYQNKGTHLPKLFLTDNSGCSSFSPGKDTIMVDTLVPALTISPNLLCQNSPLTFIDSSYSDFSSSKSWLWTFSPGFTSTVDTSTYSFTTTGTHTITLQVTNGSGCTATIHKNITVVAAPSAISGASAICIGQPAPLSDPTGGGTWSSSNTTVATIGSGNGLLTGKLPATVTITYTLLSTGCNVTASEIIDPSPPAITGSTTICSGFITQLSNTMPGGSWVSSNTFVATVGSNNGLVTGFSAGTATITYLLSTGCMATTIVTVNSSPTAISGPLALCLSMTATLSNGVTGGNWLSSNTTVATIDPGSGMVTSIGLGTSIITYTLGSGCTIKTTVTVNPTPPAISSISGLYNVCLGKIILLSDAISGQWQSSNTSVATVSLFTGIVSSLSAGTTTISFTAGTGCAITKTVTVNPLPSPISGTTALCQGSSGMLSDVDMGGTWKSSIVLRASVGSTSGDITGLLAGTSAITYTLPTGCATSVTVTILPSPSAIKGITNVCAGNSTLLTATGGSLWSSSNTTVATVGSSGNVAGIAYGTASISYILTSNGCYTIDTVTVDSLPLPLLGTYQLCQGFTTTLSDPGGGTWTSILTSVATIGSNTGSVTGISTGSTVVTYQLATGCFTTTNVIVNPLPPAISGNATICIGDTAILSDANTSGAWSIDVSTIATIGNASGVITGISGGTATVTYTLSTGCITTKTITVNNLPAPITGSDNLCFDQSTTFSDITGTGSWTASNTLVSVGPITGVVFGATTGTATITYELPTSCVATKQITVTPLPTAITGNKNICLGFSTILTDTTSGGIWSSADTTVTVSAGSVSGIALGTATITYILSVTGCFTTATMAVNPNPPAITGTTYVCPGAITALTDTFAIGGGGWGSGDLSIASVDATGAVTGKSAGTTTITYTTAAGCIAVITVTVNPVIPDITGKTTLCKGTTSALLNTAFSGVWSSSNTSIATINTSGVVTGLSAGNTTISYYAPNTCDTAQIKVTVNPLPDAGTIKGNTTICTGTTTIFIDTATGGTWASSNSSTASINSASGLVDGVSAGTATISYVYTNSCGTAKTNIAVTVNQTPGTAHIVTYPDSVLCSNTLYQNFGADAPEPTGEVYTWYVDNGVIYATSASRQYCLVSFNAPGASIVTLSTMSLTNGCNSTDSRTFNITPGESPLPVVVYDAPEFICKDNTAQSYQWGYDDALTLDSTLLAGMINQNYYNPIPAFSKYHYWVITIHNGCMQKSYYNAPTGITNISEGGTVIKLFPNPAGSVINIEILGTIRKSTINAALYDMLGKERQMTDVINGAGTFQLSGLPPGAYMIRLSKEGVKIGSATFVKE